MSEFSELSEAGKAEAVEIIEKFKKHIKSAIVGAVEETLDEVYRDVVPYIETDAWSNFRSDVVNEICGYHHNGLMRQYDFVLLRQSILENHRDEIVQHLNQDLLKEVEELKQTVEILRTHR